MKKVTVATWLVIISIVLMTIGFGLIHNGNSVVEYIGSAMIGIPAFFLIILLFRKYFSKSDME